LNALATQLSQTTDPGQRAAINAEMTRIRYGAGSQ
jgi:hypothetical protein